MNILAICYAALALGALGLLFGAVLTFAGKKFAVQVDERVEQVRQCLAGANCGACGYAGCDAFAKAVVEGAARADGCPAGGAKTAAAVAKIMGTDSGEHTPMIARVICQGEYGVSRERYEYDGYHSCLMASKMAGGPKQCRYACVGLGDCVSVCRFGALSVVNGLAVVDPEKCTACGMCEKVCPRHVIQLKPKDATVLVHCQNSDTGRVAREGCTRACIGCKRCEKECKYDAIHVVNGFARIDESKCTRCGDCAKVCPCGCITITEQE